MADRYSIAWHVACTSSLHDAVISYSDKDMNNSVGTEAQGALDQAAMMELSLEEFNQELKKG